MGFLTSIVIPPSRSIRSLNWPKSTITTWLTCRPVRRLIVATVSVGPPIWKAALIFAVPWSGIGTQRSRRSDRYAIRWWSGSVRTSRIESECRSPARALRFEWSVPSKRIVVECVSSRPFCEASCGLTPCGSRCSAAWTPSRKEK